MMVKIKEECSSPTCEACGTKVPVCESMLGQEGGGAQLSGLFPVIFSS